MVAIAETTELAAFVEMFESFEPYYPYQHAAIYVTENDGSYSVFYLEDNCFYGMGARVLETVTDTDGDAMLFPYHLLSDSRVSPVVGTLLSGVEYSCIASEQICDDFKQFYQLTGHYEMIDGENGFSLVTDQGQVTFFFVDHAGLTFVSIALAE